MKKIMAIFMSVIIALAFSISAFAANPNIGGTQIPQPLPTDQIYNISDYYTEYYYSYTTGYRYSVGSSTAYYVPTYDSTGAYVSSEKILFMFPISQVVSAPWYNDDGNTYPTSTDMSGFRVGGISNSVSQTTTTTQYLEKSYLVPSVNDYYLEMGYYDTYAVAANQAANYIVQLDTYGENIDGIGMVGGYRIDSSLSSLTISVLGRAEFLLTNGQYYDVEEIEFTRAFNGSIITTPSFFTSELTDSEVESYHFKGTIMLSRPAQTSNYNFSVAAYSRYARSNSEYINVTDGEMSVAQGEEWSEYQSFYNNPQYRIHDEISYARYSGNSTPPSGTLDVSITDNGTYTYNVYGYAEIAVDVNVDTTVIPPDTPSGDVLQITQNGEYDVQEYRYAKVNVPQDVNEFPSLFGWVGNVLDGVLDFELMPNFSLGGILIIIVGLALIVWLLKVFLGG